MVGTDVSPVCQGGNELTTRKKLMIALAATVACALFASSAYAVPANKLQQARAVKSQVDELDRRAGIADENYLEAKIAHDKLIKQQKEVEGRLKKIQGRMGTVQDHLGTRATNMYRTGQMGFVDVLLGAESFEEFATTWDLLKDLNSDDAAAVTELKDLRADAKKAQAELDEKETAAAAQLAVMKKNKAAADKNLTERKRLLAGIEAEIAQIEAAENQARAARAATLMRRPAVSERNFPPPTRAARGEVVSVAQRYLGAPYRWADSGPNSFDCSGFTMFVYRQVGVSLPHSSRAQIGYGERVSRSELQPGDLVFFGSPIHHVGIYVGGGQMIHAPHTGAVVRIDPLHSNYSGACRP